MKNLLLGILILSLSGCKKNPEKLLLKSDSIWSFDCEIKRYDKNSVLLSTSNYSYELKFESETTGKYRKLNSNDNYKPFTCEFVKGFTIGCRLDITLAEISYFSLPLKFDKVKKKKMSLSGTTSNSFDFVSSNYSYVKSELKAEMEKL